MKAAEPYNYDEQSDEPSSWYSQKVEPVNPYDGKGGISIDLVRVLEQPWARRRPIRSLEVAFHLGRLLNAWRWLRNRAEVDRWLPETIMTLAREGNDGKCIEDVIAVLPTILETVWLLPHNGDRRQRIHDHICSCQEEWLGLIKCGHYGAELRERWDDPNSSWERSIDDGCDPGLECGPGLSDELARPSGWG